MDRESGAVTLFEPPEPAPLTPPVVRVRMTVAYDGRGFHGFTVQPGLVTVGGTLTKAIERVLRHPVVLTAAGRTDKGVHARGQVISFDASAAGLELPALERALNKLCAPSIAVRDARIAAPDFDARFSATARRYSYSILNDPRPDPFLASTAWHVDEPLDVPGLRLACDPLLGEHDFASFCRRPDANASLVRLVVVAEWQQDDSDPRLLRFWIEANAFCHQMVRALVGTLVEVGRGRRRAGEMAGILRAVDRAAAGQLAPAHGLCLWAVRYPDDTGAGPSTAIA
jgi:tRNA pseudouridine38-40 synthase